jgi:hypothetical protein
MNFASGTPPEIRKLIGDYLAVPDLPAELRAGIERLGGNEAMEPFWRQLPKRLQRRETDIILWAIEAYYEAISLSPPREYLQKEIDEFSQSHASTSDPALLAQYQSLVDRASPPLTYSGIAYIARWRHESLGEIWSIGRQQWAEAWPGHPELSFDKLRSIVEDIAVCCDRLDADAQALYATKHLPEPPRKLGGRSVQRVYFDRILKERFRANFGYLYPSIVATLEQVAFDLPEAVDESTVLKR